jgi:putative ABC transport system permease protein
MIMQLFFRSLITRLAADPLATIMSVLALAVGIGVNVACFTSIDAIILNPFPFRQPAQLIRVWETTSADRSEHALLAPGDFADWKVNSARVMRMAAFARGALTYGNSETTRQIEATFVTPEFFDTLAMDPQRGRVLVSERHSDDERELVISHAMWRDSFSSDENAVGKLISLNGKNYTVIGIMPASFDFPLGTDVWLPMTLTPQEWAQRGNQSLETIARVDPRYTISQATEILQNLSRQSAEEFPATNKGITVAVTSLSNLPPGLMRRFLVILLGSASFVLLLACVNVSNIGLLRAVRQKKNYAIRVALGASRREIAKSIMGEAVCISCIAGIFGIAVAWISLELTRSYIPEPVFRMVQGLKGMHITRLVALYTVVVSVVAGLLCAIPSLAYSLRQVGSKLDTGLTEGGRSAAFGRAGSRLQSAIVTIEISMALVLLLGAGFMYKTFSLMLREDVGFNTDGLLTVNVSLPSRGYQTHDLMRNYYNKALDQVSQIPGVVAVALSAGEDRANTFSVDDRLLTPADLRPAINGISNDYLKVMEIPIIAGRSIGSMDTRDGRKVALVSSSVARYYWPHGDPLTRRISWDHESFAVVGVTGDVKAWFGNQPIPQVFISSEQVASASQQMLVRTGYDPGRLSHVVAAVLTSLDPQTSINNLKTYTQIRQEQTSGIQIAAIQMATYGIFALILSIAGIYSITSYRAALRTREIGLRMAMGADRKDIFKLCLQMSMYVVIIGAIVGIMAGLTLTRIMAHTLSGTVALTVTDICAVTGALACAVFVAIAIPSRRAMTIEPSVALRE